MLLPVPVVSIDPGPDWANNINSCLGIIDGHNHTTGQGVQITPAGIDINTDLPLNGNNLITARSVRFSPQSVTLSNPADIGCLYEVNADLYYNDGAGNQIRITQSGSVTGSSGTITGLPSGTASASYSAGTFTFQSATNTPATLNVGNIIIGQEVPSGFNVTLETSPSQAANYALVFPAVSPTANQVLQSDGSGNLTWTRGLIPLGSVIATFPNLSGAYTTAATTTADANGYVLCAGQTIADSTSPMNGAIVPNINNSVFLMGSTTAGSTGGNNTNTQVAAHTHGAGTFVTSVGVTGGTASLTGTTSFAATSHTHNFAHSHQWAYYAGGTNTYGLVAANNANAGLSTGNTNIMQQSNIAYTSGSFPAVSFGWVTTAGGIWTTGVASNNNSGTGSSASTGTESADASVGISSTAASMTGSNSVTGTSASTGSSYDSRPNFISAVYLMRIK